MSNYYGRNNNTQKNKVSFSDFVEPSNNNNKSNLSILEEGDNTDLQQQNKHKIQETTLEDDDSAGSSLENLASNVRSNTNQLAISYTQSNKQLNDIPETAALNSRRPSVILQEILSTRRPSAIMSAIRRGSHSLLPSFHRSKLGGLEEEHVGAKSVEAIESRRKNRRVGDDALSTALSALYAKFIVIMGIALPVTEILSSRIPATFYQGFYVYLYVVSIAFIVFVYITHLRTRAVFTIIKNYHEKNNNYPIKKTVPHFGSFYLRVGAIAFGIGTMVYSGLELGQYFELKSGDNDDGCNHILMVLTPAARMMLSIVQMQFIFLNTTELDIARHKVVARFGLMHMVATNLCEWLYVLVEETKHEIFHLAHSQHESSTIEPNHSIPIHVSSSMNLTETTEHSTFKRSLETSSQYQDCQRTSIMGSLVQNASPFLFPCTIEYSLICAVILFEMWKKVRSIPEIARTRKSSLKPAHGEKQKSAHHFSIDCSRAHRGMFGGIIVIVLTIICLIMYFVLHKEPAYRHLAIAEVTYYEILLYTVTGLAVIAAMFRMRDLKFQKKITNDHHASTVKLDCTLLVLAGVGVYVYGMFSIMGSLFAIQDDLPGARNGLIAEILSLVQVSLQTLFILNACWRRCRGAQQNRMKPGRQIVTFLLVANISMWFINTLIKGQASFRPSHLEFFGSWAWTVITHVSMPLAIFYRFHSTICLFDIWKHAYKFK
ncbi:unnamed protein product, partial [Diamesa hyperborea]